MIAANPCCLSSRARPAHLSSMNNAKCNSWPRTASTSRLHRVPSRKGSWRRVTARTCSSTAPRATSSSNHAPTTHQLNGQQEIPVPSTAHFCISVPLGTLPPLPRSAICPCSKSTGRAVTGPHFEPLGPQRSAHRLIPCSPRALGRPRRFARPRGGKEPDVYDVTVRSTLQ